MAEPIKLEAIYTKVVQHQDRWYREVYVGSPDAWQFLAKIEVEPDEPPAEAA